jgi:ABC-type amino acid transport system permease subunit
MTEQLHFCALAALAGAAGGLWVTVQLTVLATIGGLAIGIFGAAIRSGRTTWFSRIWGGMWKSSATRRLWCSCFLSSSVCRIWAEDDGG